MCATVEPTVLMPASGPRSNPVHNHTSLRSRLGKLFARERHSDHCLRATSDARLHEISWFETIMLTRFKEPRNTRSDVVTPTLLPCEAAVLQPEQSN